MSKKEWLNEPGYCNCLLVVMARIPVRQVKLTASAAVPNLEQMAATSEETRSWIQSQQFDYASLNPSKVIDILMVSATLSRSFWGRKTGTINVVDVVGNDGPEVERVFRVSFSKSREGDVLFVELKGA